jgi:hypothetical protein
MKEKPLLFLALACFSMPSAQLSTAFGQGTVFTYQGRLNDGAIPATGSYDLRFTLYDAVSNGNLIGSLTHSATRVTNGLFTAALDFGGVFTGADYWLEIAARTNGAATFVTLSPRQSVTPTPYAIYSANAATAGTVSGSVPAGQLTGTIPLAQLPGAAVTNGASSLNLSDNLSGTFTGNGAGVSGVDLRSVNSQGAITFTTSYGLNFVLASTPGVSNGPISVTSADVNGDGKPDLISVNELGNTLTVLTNDGSGGFLLAATLGTGSTPDSATAADVNGDGKLDLICANGMDNTLTVWLNGPPTITANFSGNGAVLTGLTFSDASQLTNGTVADARLSANVALLNANQTFTGANALNNPANSFSGDGSGLTSLNGAHVTGDVVSAGSFTGSLNGDVTGTQNATVVASVGGQTAAAVAGGAVAANAATSADIPNTIVNRDRSGNFSAGAIAANIVSGAFTGDGSGLTGITGASIADGQVVKSLNGLNDAVTLSAGANITLTPSGNDIQIAASGSGGGISWQEVSGTAQQAQPNTGYLLENSALTTVTLPASPNAGDIVRVSGVGAGGWEIAQNSGQSILAGHLNLASGLNWTARASSRHWQAVASSSDGSKLAAVIGVGQIYISDATLPSATTTSGTAGYLLGAQSTAIELQYIANNQFLPISHEGTIQGY